VIVITKITANFNGRSPLHHPHLIALGLACQAARRKVMQKKNILLVFVLLIGIGLSSCNRPSSPTDCTSADLEAPTIISPGYLANVGEGPTTGSLPPEFFQWEYDSDCPPEQFKLRFSSDRHFGTTRVGTTDGELTWPPADTRYSQVPLEPATMYFWYVYAITDGVDGPNSATQAFFTGPACGGYIFPVVPSAPELISPARGEVLGELSTELHFQVGERKCLPQGYFVELETDPGFSGTNLLTEFVSPSTYVLTEELDDCTAYYWRVTGVNWGYRGYVSETRVFYTRASDDCISAPATVARADLTLPHCTPEELVAPELVYPWHNCRSCYSARYTTIPVGFFNWTFPGRCFPDGYHLLLSIERDLSSARSDSTEGEVYWPVESLYSEPPLEPATQYFWSVQAEADGVLGPESATYTFFTSPQYCTTLTSPQLQAPYDGTVIHERSVWLHFMNGDENPCWPDWFHIEVQTDPEELIGLSPETTPRTIRSSTDSFYRLYGRDLHDCTTYFWRVAGINDRYTGRSVGPYSEVWSFSTDWSGACAYAAEGTPMARASTDLPCLQGPDPATYPTVGYLLAGERAAILAQSMDRQWWYIDNPDGTDICAVPMDSTTADGDVSELPRFNNPEIEPEEPESGGGDASPCAGLSVNVCPLTPGCTWKLVPTPHCE
jgi:hypothetical protein